MCWHFQFVSQKAGSYLHHQTCFWAPWQFCQFCLFFSMIREESLNLCTHVRQRYCKEESVSLPAVGVYNTSLKGFIGQSARLCACPLLSRRQAEQRKSARLSPWLPVVWFTFISICWNRSFQLSAALRSYKKPRPLFISFFFGLLVNDARPAYRRQFVEIEVYML